MLSHIVVDETAAREYTPEQLTQVPADISVRIPSPNPKEWALDAVLIRTSDGKTFQTIMGYIGFLIDGDPRIDKNISLPIYRLSIDAETLYGILQYIENHLKPANAEDLQRWDQGWLATYSVPEQVYMLIALLSNFRPDSYRNFNPANEYDLIKRAVLTLANHLARVTGINIVTLLHTAAFDRMSRGWYIRRGVETWSPDVDRSPVPLDIPGDRPRKNLTEILPQYFTIS